jgi:hypothetical protein
MRTDPFELGDQREAIHVWHVHVAEHDIEVLGARSRQGSRS